MPRTGRAGSYGAELKRQCPERRLQYLAAGDLDPLMERFSAKLSLVQRRQIEDAVGERCVRVEAGQTCANAATLETFRRQGVLRRFVQDVCAATWTCRGLADCTQVQP